MMNTSNLMHHIILFFSHYPLILMIFRSYFLLIFSFLSIRSMTELMFETFNAPAVFISKDCVLECYACGRTTGLVVDIGANGTVLSPVLDGYVDARGLNKSIIGGRYMDSYVLSLIKKQAMKINSTTAMLPHFRVKKIVGQDRGLYACASGVENVHSTYDAFMNLEMGRDLRESVCRVAESTLVETDPRFANLPMTIYELPDGTIVDMGIERFQMCEMLFDPSIINEENNYDLSLLGYQSGTSDGIARLVSNSILKCDTEVQGNLLQNLIIAGGGSCTEGMPERIKLEVENLVHSSAPGLRIKTIALGTSERSLTTFLGGSILASLGSFHEMWMSRQEYDEHGPGLGNYLKLSKNLFLIIFILLSI